LIARRESIREGRRQSRGARRLSMCIGRVDGSACRFGCAWVVVGKAGGIECEGDVMLRVVEQ
jgi:hypothetical protein